MSAEAVVLLRSIDASLKELVGIARAKRGGAATVASDRDLDSQYGDPVVKFNPRDWQGEDCKGRTFSLCQPDFLDMIAETFDYFARKSEDANELTDKGKPKAEFKRADAARARGWAARIRSGKVTQATRPTNGAGGDEWSGSDEFR